MVKTMHVPNDIGGAGRVVSWMKKEGALFKKGEPMFEVETAKTTIQVDAPEAGTLLRITANQGTAVISGSAVALYAAEGEPVPPELLKPASPATLVIRLLDEESGLVTDAKVSVSGREFEPAPDGSFMITGLAPTSVTVSVKAPGFLEKILVLRLAEGETAKHELNLVSIERLRGSAKAEKQP